MFIQTPPPIIVTNAVDQATTALNTNIVYNIANLFTNYDSTPVTMQTPMQSNGSVLPSWIAFDGTKLTISTTTIANIKIIITAVGYHSLTTSQTFNVTITNTSPGIIGSFGSATIYENKTYSVTKDWSTVFNEVDTNQVLIYTVTGVPAFLTLTKSGSQYTFSGIPAFSDIGSYSISMLYCFNLVLIKYCN